MKRLVWGHATGKGFVTSRVNGARFRLDLSDYAQAFAWLSGHWERRVLSFCTTRLGPGGTAIDVGANVGFIAVPLARHCAQVGGVLHTFDPHPGYRERLEANLSLNALNGAPLPVKVNGVALSSDIGTGQLNVVGGGLGSWSVIDLGHAELPPGRRMEVPITTLDRYAAESGIERVDVMKVDVEGLEPLVIRGAAGLIGEGAVRALVCEFNRDALERSGSSVAELAGLVTDLGFEEVSLPRPGLGLLRPRRRALKPTREGSWGQPDFERAFVWRG
jgi:FkbM family methyltransferase